MDLADIVELYSVFSQVPDPRDPRGVRHGLASVLTVMVCAVLAGAQNFRDAADHLRDLPDVVVDAARTRRDPRDGRVLVPSLSTVRRVIETIDAARADLLVGQWITDRVTGKPDYDADRGGCRGVAIDGKQVRHSAGNQPQNVTLFSAMLHDQAVVIGQIRVPDGTNEITQVPALLGSVDLERAVVTADTAHCQITTAEYLRGRNAHYVLTVKGNQPSLLEHVRTLIDEEDKPGYYRHVQTGRGRVIERQIWVVPAQGVAFPGVKQVFRVRRDTYDLQGNLLRTETVHGVTSLSPKEASPAMLAGLIRAHWGIENKIHWVRDVIFREDHHYAYTGAAAHVMAIFRNLATALIRLAGHTQIKRTLQYIAADRTRILPLLAASRPSHQP